MQCPRCRVDLAMSERHGVEIDYCPKCRGVWLDRGELDKIIERAPQHYGAAPYGAPPPTTPPPRPAYPADDDRWVHGHQRRKKKSFLEDIFDFD